MVFGNDMIDALHIQQALFIPGAPVFHLFTRHGSYLSRKKIDFQGTDFREKKMQNVPRLEHFFNLT